MDLLDVEHVKFHAQSMDRELEQDILDMIASEHSCKEVFEMWSWKCEQVFQRALQSQHTVDPQKWPKLRLTAKYWGRGCEPRLKQKAPQSLTKKARDGDFNPNYDVQSLLAKQRVRQTRRLYSLLQRIKSQEKRGIEVCNTQNASEWQAICDAVGYGFSFVQWLLSNTELPFVELGFPTKEHLEDIHRYVKADADRLCQNEYQQRRKSFARFIKDDWKLRGGHTTFSHMNAQTQATFSAMMVPCRICIVKGYWVSKGVLQYIVTGRNVPQIGDKLQINAEMFEVYGRGHNWCSIKAQGYPNDFFPCQTDTVVHTWVYKPDDMAAGFFRYWSSFWERDPVDNEDDQWQEALETLNVLPSLPTKPMDVTLDDLREAIVTTPSKSARGLCGWHIKELKILPECLLKHLLVALKHFMQTQWPEVMTWVRLALPPKVEEPVAPQDGRPICIMSQIYRVFAKALSKHMLAYLSMQLPPQINGGVPGRSVEQIWYAIQAQVERSRHHQQQIFGFCLDIQKAFNAVPRYVVVKAMIRVGIPEQVAWSWYRLLQNLKRSVKVAGTSSTLHPSTTGIPEGDPISVPCMAVICWIFHATAAGQGTQPWAYADNWEFLTDCIAKLASTIRETTKLLEAWKMKADVKKSWCWSALPINKKQQTEIQAIFGDQNCPIVSTAKDLGATMRYRRVQCARISKQRFDAAIVRARRLASVPGTLSERWRALLGSSMSMALYGIEIVPLGYDHFKLLRSAIADIICKTWKQRNEHLACSLTHQGIADPEVYAIKKCIRMCRKFLHMYHDLWYITMAILRDNSPEPKDIHGPIGCLKRWFHKLGWQITASDNIKTEQGLVFSLVYTCPSYVNDMVDMAWERHVLREISHRKGMDSIVSVNFAATTKMLAKRDEVSQQIMVRYLTGSNVYGDSAKHWGSGDGSCEFCLHPHDSQHHRICECRAFECIREPIEQTMSWIEANAATWPSLPVIQRSEDEHRMRQICALRPLQVSLPWKTQEPDVTPCVFTDGSCINPTCREGALATFAVIHDISLSHEHPAIVRAFNTTKCIPPTFRTVIADFVGGPQGNDRAELVAILHAVARFYWIHIHTDSTYAKDVVSHILDHNRAAWDSQCPNFDIILELRRVIGDRSHSHIKLQHVRAHRDIEGIADYEEAFNALGNFTADKRASDVWNDNRAADVRMMANRIRDHYELHAKHWGIFADFLTNMTKRISDFNKDHKHQEQPVLREVSHDRPNFVRLMDWTISGESYTYNFDLTVEQSRSFPHPSYFVLAVSAWLRKLKWPSDITDSDIGVTWLELIADFIASTAVHIPVQKGKHRGYHIYESSGNGLVKDDLNTQIVVFRSCIKLIGAMIQQPVYPSHRSINQCKSLCGFAGSRPTAGLRGRPILVSQHSTIHALAKFFEKGAHIGLTTTWNGAFPFDRSNPVVEIQTLSQEDPPNLKRIATYISVLLKNKRNQA
eukprot:Skav213292  [mRNA]  locus=scaffold2480:175207:179580:+ [translate_table: standard]